MFNLEKLFLPTTFDFVIDTQKITLRTPEYLSEGYFDNTVCTLQLTFQHSDVFIDYYCDDDNYLGSRLELVSACLAVGNLKEESFASIQQRALTVISKHIVESQKELLEHFNKI